MTDKRNKMLFATPVMLAVLAAIPFSGFAEQELEFTYSDEWSVVSAPPPSGPYRAVHVDPRVPGQGVIPPVTSSFEVADPATTPSPDVRPGSIDSAAVTTPATQPLVTERVDASDQAATGMTTAVPMNEESLVIEPPVPGDAATASAPEADASDTAAATVTATDEQSRMATGVPDTAQDGGTEVLAPPALSTSTDKIDAVQVPAAAVAPVDIVKPAPVDVVKPAPVVEVPVQEKSLVAPMLPPAVPGHYAPGLPEVAGREADMPAARPPVPGVADNAMPPPAAGAPGVAMTPPPTGRPDTAESFGRMMPQPPAYNYPGRNWQPGWGMPGYGNTPPYGYYRGPADGMGNEVPPPGRYVPPPNYGGPYPGR